MKITSGFEWFEHEPFLSNISVFGGAKTSGFILDINRRIHKPSSHIISFWQKQSSDIGHIYKCILHCFMPFSAIIFMAWNFSVELKHEP